MSSKEATGRWVVKPSPNGEGEGEGGQVNQPTELLRFPLTFSISFDWKPKKVFALMKMRTAAHIHTKKTSS